MHVKILHPMHVDFPSQQGWPERFLPVGLIQLDGDDTYHPLTFEMMGRVRKASILRGHEYIWRIEDSASIGAAYYTALDEACSRIWGHSWNAALGKIFGLNRRTLQRDRVTNYLLSKKIAYKISYIASLDDAQEMGQMLIAVAEYDEFIRKSRPNAEPQEYAENFIRSALHIFYGKPEDLEE